MKKYLIVLLTLIYSFVLLVGCKDNDNVDISGMSYINESGDYLIIDNGTISVTINKFTGYMRTVKNIQNDTVYKNPESGSWPFELDFGFDRDLVAISKDTKNRVSSITSKKVDDTEILSISYDNLVTQQDKKTGIKAVVNFTIGKDDNYLKINTDFDLRGCKNSTDGIYELRYTYGGDLVGAGDNKRLTAPTWNGGQYWTSFADQSFSRGTGVTFAYPGENQSTLCAGWMDYSGDNGGIGIGLINKHEMATEFRVKKTTKGLSITNAQFNPQQILGTSVPLLKGETFASDNILVVAHAGDWHDTVDAYREEYYKVFVDENGNPDYLTEATLSKNAMRADYIVRGCAGQDGELVSTFDEMKEFADNTVLSLEANYEDMIFWLHGQNAQGYAFDVPFQTPTYEASGGDAELKAMDEYFQSKGASVFHYNHPFAVDPNRAEIAAILDKVDPKQHTEYWNLCTHHSVCINNDIMYNLWAEQIIPAMKALSINGMQFDQSPLMQTVCDMEGHNHGLDALSRLSSHSKGLVKLQKLVRSSIQDGFLLGESSSDILTRYVDIQPVCWHAGLIYGGELELGAYQYTFPNYVYQPSSIYKYTHSSGSVATESSFLHVGLYGGIVCISDGGDLNDKKEFIRFRKDITSANAPGFPYGFKDDVGVSFDNSTMQVKVYVGENAVTVVTMTMGAVNEEPITINLERLGFTGAGTRTIKVTQGNRKLGYQVINV